MGRMACAAALGIALVVVMVRATPNSLASLYTPEDTFAIPVGSDGVARPLPFNEFKRRLAVLTNAMVEPKFGEKDNADRLRFLDRARAHENTPKLSSSEAAAVAVDLLRAGQSDQALNLLGPRTSDRRPDYFVFTTLGHIHAARGEWSEALRYHQEGLLDTAMPKELKGLSPTQRDWWQNLDQEYVAHFYRIRNHEAEKRRGLNPTDLDHANEQEDVLALFPLSQDDKTQTPLRFVNEKGEYEPGVLADAEKAKLPPDALAIAQQLVLWYPTETRLYWLLAEIYAALGDLDSAIAIFDELAWSRQYGNRKVLMDHRSAIRAAIDARPKPVEPEIEDAPISMKTVMIYFGVVGAIGVIALIRTLLKRKPDEGCGPIG